MTPAVLTTAAMRMRLARSGGTLWLNGTWTSAR